MVATTELPSKNATVASQQRSFLLQGKLRPYDDSEQPYSAPNRVTCLLGNRAFCGASCECRRSAGGHSERLDATGATRGRPRCVDGRVTSQTFGGADTTSGSVDRGNKRKGNDLRRCPEKVSEVKRLLHFHLDPEEARCPARQRSREVCGEGAARNGKGPTRYVSSSGYISDSAGNWISHLDR